MKKDDQINIRIEVDLKREFEYLCIKTGRKMSSQIKVMIKQFIESEKK